MSDEFGTDPLDDELRRGFRAAAPPAGDVDATLDGLTPRFERARRRHRMVVAGGSALVAAVIVVAGAVALTGGGGAGQSVRVPPADRGRVTTTVPTVTTGPAPNLPGAPDTTAPQDPGTAPETTGTTPAPTPAGPGPAATVAPPVTPAGPVDRTYTSAGGSLTIRVTDGAMSILSTAPALGYAEERPETGPARVEVRFRSPSGEWRIRVQLVDGEPREEITEH